MNRLIEKTVFSGLVIAWRFATWPTRISPSLVKATTDGVMRLPSWFGMTTGLPPSITATTELVVPRSMPITLPIGSSWWSPGRGGNRDRGGGSRLDRDPACAGSRGGLRELDRQHAVPDACRGAVRIQPRRQRDGPDEAPVPGLGHVEVLALVLLLLALLAPDDQRARRDRELKVLTVEP